MTTRIKNSLTCWLNKKTKNQPWSVCADVIKKRFASGSAQKVHMRMHPFFMGFQTWGFGSSQREIICGPIFHPRAVKLESKLCCCATKLHVPFVSTIAKGVKEVHFSAVSLCIWIVIGQSKLHLAFFCRPPNLTLISVRNKFEENLFLWGVEAKVKKV